MYEKTFVTISIFSFFIIVIQQSQYFLLLLSDKKIIEDIKIGLTSLARSAHFC